MHARQAADQAINYFHQAARGDAAAIASEREWIEEMVRRANQERQLIVEKIAPAFFSSEITQLKNM